MYRLVVASVYKLVDDFGLRRCRGGPANCNLGILDGNHVHPQRLVISSLYRLVVSDVGAAVVQRIAIWGLKLRILSWNPDADEKSKEEIVVT